MRFLALVLMLSVGLFATYCLFVTSVFYLGTEDDWLAQTASDRLEQVGLRTGINVLLALLLLGGWWVLEYVARHLAEKSYAIGWRTLRFRILVVWLGLVALLLPPLFWIWLQ